MRSNLLSLQNIAGQVDLTQNRLSTGLKVNSAIDNPSSYYTAVSLNNRASDLSALLDSMAQGIQTIKAATEGLEAGAALLEQASAIASQALNGSYSDTDSLEDYTVITSEMSSAEIETLMTDGAKLVLADDVVLDTGLVLAVDNVTINGNGHSLTYQGTDDLLSVSGQNTTITNIKLNYENNAGGSAIEVTGSADISFIEIEAQGNKVYGIHCGKDGKITLDNTMGFQISGKGSHNLINGNAELYDGKGNTQAIVDQIVTNSAIIAPHQFYAPGVAKNDANFGQGQWYLPSIGELMDLYGTNYEAMTEGNGTSGAVGDNKDKVNEALQTLNDNGVNARILWLLSTSAYWSSSEGYTGSFGSIRNGGARSIKSAASGAEIRCFSYLENCFNPTDNTPKIGDVMYADMSYGSADNYDSNKTAVGVVAWVSEDGRSAKIVNLNDLSFNSDIPIFNPDTPYQGNYSTTNIGSSSMPNITGITDYYFPEILEAVQSRGKISVSNTNLSGSDIPTDENNNSISAADQIASYNEILSQYDSLIKDSSYKGINLLREQDLILTFNENRSSRLSVQGKDASAKALGLSSAAWETVEDVSLSLEALSSALNQIRQMTSELGNYYSIVTTRENFTQNLINVLTEGADKLTLADMNEESANMLALQTRQQLAVNSLSLASQASQSILKLF